METVSLKMEKNLLKDIDSSLKTNRYSTRTEFIRDAIRSKLDEFDKKRRIEGLAKLKGSVKNIKRLSHKEREKLVYELWEKKKKGINLFKEFGL